MTKWVPAYGEHQLPFLGAASRVLQGNFHPCPKCGAELHAYFHVLQSRTGKGSLWVWCATCHMYTTLPRVKPIQIFPDPFAEVPRGEFGAMEMSREEPFFDRLERMWSNGELQPRRPGPPTKAP